MKERPILFSGAMVRALLDGTKTQTRRVAKLNAAGRVARAGKNWHLDDPDAALACPYGSPGDRLWVREAWRVGAWDEDDGTIAVDYRADGHVRCEWLTLDADHDGEKFNRLWIQSSEDAEKALGRPHHDERYVWVPGASPCRWRPGIHMPRAFARILLEITDVRVERLQAISGADALAEGIEIPAGGHGNPLLRLTGAISPDAFTAKHPDGWTLDDYARFEYAELWASINGPASWNENPWVWAVTFKPISTTGDKP